MVLTEAGKVLVAHAVTILAGLEAAEVALAELAELRRGRLRMASFATAGASVLPRAIDVFRARHPGVALTIRLASPAESLAGLREGRLDLALTVDLDPKEGVEIVQLFDVTAASVSRSHRTSRPDVESAPAGSPGSRRPGRCRPR